MTQDEQEEIIKQILGDYFSHVTYTPATPPAAPDPNDKSCRECHGEGWITWQENQSPLGSGMYWPETFYDLCNHCLGLGKCPGCGETLAVDESGRLLDVPCTCGWTLDNEAKIMLLDLED